MNKDTYISPGTPATQPPPKTLEQLADDLAQKTSGVEVFQPAPPSPKLPPNVLSP